MKLKPAFSLKVTFFDTWNDGICHCRRSSKGEITDSPSGGCVVPDVLRAVPVSGEGCYKLESPFSRLRPV